MVRLDYIENNILGFKAKADFGSCYCGGGLRACVLTYGSISELIDMGIMEKVKYVSGVSGATWFIAGYTYYNSKIKFDKYIEPENCNLTNLKHLDGDTFGKTLDDVNLATEMIESFVDLSDRKINAWNTVVYESFFEKHGEIDERYNWDILPCPIINSTISYTDVDERLFSMEFTPLYSSVPIYYKKNNIEYGAYNVDVEKTCSNYNLVPYIQSGLSSAFFEAGKELITKNKYDGTQYELYNPNSNQINVANLVDGGIFDNAGIIGLLRRKLSNIHANIYCSEEFTSDKFMKNANYFTSLFKGNPESEKYGIFKFGLWEKIYSQLIYKHNNGMPLTVIITTEIESNNFFQIDGYGPINFLFHIASGNKNWFSKLPIETKKYIDKNIASIPNIKTTIYKFSSIEINLMYNLIRYDIKNSMEYKQFYSKLIKNN